MRPIVEIKNKRGLSIKREERNGFGGTVYSKVTFKNGSPKFDNPLNFIFSVVDGWEHLSVSTPVRCPTWEEMQYMKEFFWKDDEVCFQLHPAKENYINNHPYVLHIWRKVDQDPPLPPLGCVGIRTDEHAEEDMKCVEWYAQNIDKWEEQWKEYGKGE